MILPHFSKTTYRHLHVLHHDGGIRRLYTLRYALTTRPPAAPVFPRPEYPL